ncbi:MAG: hypothetical protein ACOCXT_00040 [Candidatus Dojkabacteria bacterium]
MNPDTVEKYPRTEVWVIKDLLECLYTQIRLILQRNQGNYLITGKKDSFTNLFPRELLGLFLIACVMRELTGEEWKICSDPDCMM